jgi:hypothetical protein
VATPRTDVIGDVHVLRLLGAQWGIATAAQLGALGLSRWTLKRRVDAGVLVPVLPGVYRSADHSPTFRSRAMAVQLHTAPDGVLSSASAAHLYGLRGMPTGSVYVTVTRRTRTALPGWVRKTCTSWLEDIDVTTVDGFRLLRPVRMLLTLAELFNDFRFERAAEDAWHLELVRPADAAEFLARYRRRGRRGIARFDRWLDKTSERRRPSQSGFELEVLGAIRQVGLPEPSRQYPLTLANGELIHLDLAWPDAQLAVEPGHSWWHGGDLGQRADQARDRACNAVGWDVARYDQAARADLAAVGRELREIYGKRRALLERT